jgi:hypothetical protein
MWRRATMECDSACDQDTVKATQHTDRSTAEATVAIHRPRPERQPEWRYMQQVR